MLANVVLDLAHRADEIAGLALAARLPHLPSWRCCWHHRPRAGLGRANDGAERTVLCDGNGVSCLVRSVDASLWGHQARYRDVVGGVVTR
jgi:hypothetical protein